MGTDHAIPSARIPFLSSDALMAKRGSHKGPWGTGLIEPSLYVSEEDRCSLHLRCLLSWHVGMPGPRRLISEASEKDKILRAPTSTLSWFNLLMNVSLARP